MDPARPIAPPSALAASAKQTSAQAGEGTVAPASTRVGCFRWVICALLLFGVTKNYIDRQVLGVLKNTLQHDFGWNEIQYGHLVSYFQIAYAAGMLLVGRLIDRLGTRVGYALAMTFWSLASMAHAAAGSFATFAAARFALGFGEAGVFPASIKCVAEWFPKKERALATGIFNAGTSVGAIITPLVVPWIALHWGWRSAFLLTGALGFVWLIFWFLLYRKPDEHPRLSKAELDYIRCDPAEPIGKVSWSALLPHRQTYTFVVGKFLTDPIWWFYLFWVPDFLQRKHGLALMNIGVPIMVIYLISDVGSVAGQRRPQNHHAHLRALRYSHYFRLSHRKPLGRGPADRSRRRRASGILRESVHADLRHVSCARCRLRRRHRRHGWCHWRHAHRRGGRPRPAVDRQLYDSIRNGRKRLPHRAVPDSHPGP
jgi:ACS family hexuronate transporter-like MFS transporter